MRKLILLLLVSTCWATTTVTGHVSTLGTTAVTSSTFVRFWLRGCGGNQPRINGTSVIAPSQGGTYFFDFPVNSSGNISGTLYSTRDGAGTGNGDIECGGSQTSVWYGMVVYNSGKAGPETPVHAKSGGTLDASNVTPITTSPVINAPSGDSTYARIDGGNTPFTGAVQAPKVNSVFYVGSTYPTIDAAITAAGAGPAIVIVPSTYGGAESANLISDYLGQVRYCGQDNITILDMRGGVEHNYNQNWGGTVLGSLSRLAITQCKSSPLHTTSAGLFSNYVTGAMPPDLGTVAGLTAQVTIYGTATPQAGGRVAGFEAYTELVPTNVATWPDVRGATYSVNIDRTTAKGNITDASGLYAGPCTNTSSSGAAITNCYSFHAGQPTVATGRNYAAFVEGSMLMPNNVNFDAIDASGTVQHFVTFGGANQTTFRSLLDSAGFHFANQANNIDWLILNSSGASIPSLKLTIGSGIVPDGGGVKHLRGTTGCTTAASVGATCTTVVTWTTTFADTNYTATCTGDLITSGVPVSGGLTAKSASAVTFQTVATTASAAKFTAIDCVGIHD